MRTIPESFLFFDDSSSLAIKMRMPIAVSSKATEIIILRPLTFNFIYKYTIVNDPGSYKESLDFSKFICIINVWRESISSI